MSRSWFWDAVTPMLPVNTTATEVQRHERATRASGTCPHCGFWNDPAASVREDEALVYCNNCGETWTP